MDSLREEDGRDINHHGAVVEVRPYQKKTMQNNWTPDGTNGSDTKPRRADLIARNEKEEVEARKDYYQHELFVRKERKMHFAMQVASKGLPSLYFAFSFFYFFIGMLLYNEWA